MPCYSVVSSTVEWSDGTDAGLLVKALQALGYTATKLPQGISFAHYQKGVRGTYANGTMTVTTTRDDNEAIEAEMKRSYSAQVVKSAAQRFGWQIKESSPTQFQITRRS